MEKPNAGQIKKAVDWWVNAIKNPKHDNGDTSVHGGFARAFATLGVTEINDEQIEIFKNELTELLQSQEEAKWGLHVDYNPDVLLNRAMEKAGIGELNAPWKTNMNFRDGKVLVSHGYGADWVEV